MKLIDTSSGKHDGHFIPGLSSLRLSDNIQMVHNQSVKVHTPSPFVAPCWRLLRPCLVTFALYFRNPDVVIGLFGSEICTCN